MSTHPIPSPANDPADSLRWQRIIALRGLCLAYIGREPAIVDDGTTLSLVFDPDLTAGEQTTLARLVGISGMLRITPAEYGAAEPILRSFLQGAAATKTLAETVTALRTLVRVLVRD